MIPHIDISVTEASQAGEARRAAAALATEHGVDETARGRFAIVVTELATNLVRHAERGRLLIGCHTVPEGCQLEVISLDHGPGMDDLSRCLRDGFSTAGTPGNGLGAVRRLSSDFSAFSLPGRGSVIAARSWTPFVGHERSRSPASRFAHAGVCLPRPGQSVSGDAWAIHLDEGRARLIVADGSGDGTAAAEASDMAVGGFHQRAELPAAMLNHLHPALASTLGAAVAVVDADALAGRIVFAGAGNVAGRVLAQASRQDLVSQPGTLGLQVHDLHDLTVPWPAHGTLVLHSDGLDSSWQLDDARGILNCDPAVIAGWLIRDFATRADDVAVVVLKRP